MMVSTVRPKLLAGRACRTNRITRTARVTLRITKMIAQASSVLLLEHFLDEGDIPLGEGGFGHVGVDFEHLLEVFEGGIEFGNAVGFVGLVHEGESELVVGEGVLGIVGESL